MSEVVTESHQDGDVEMSGWGKPLHRDLSVLDVEIRRFLLLVILKCHNFSMSESVRSSKCLCMDLGGYLVRSTPLRCVPRCWVEFEMLELLTGIRGVGI